MSIPKNPLLSGRTAIPQPPQAGSRVPIAPPAFRPQSATLAQAKSINHRVAPPTAAAAPGVPGARALAPPVFHPRLIPAPGAVVQRSRTREQTLNDLQVSADLNERLILPEGKERERTSPAVYGVGDGTGYGVGAHANYEGVSTTNATRTFTADEKDGVNGLGKMYGCHTCGKKKSGWPDGHFTPDHQPPLSLAGPLHKYKGKLYPHCKSCSSKQGGMLSSSS